MEPLTDSELAKLPKWAQSHVRVLEANLKSAYEKQAATIGGSLVSKERMEIPTAAVIVEPYGVNAVVLKPNTHIAFKLGERWDTEVRIQNRDGVLDINATRSINIRPNASNSCYISIAER